MWVGEKFQSNSEIAGSPRNSFRASLMSSQMEVEHWISAGASKLTKDYQTANAVKVVHGSQAVRDKSDSQKGNSPDQQLRPQSAC